MVTLDGLHLVCLGPGGERLAKRLFTARIELLAEIDRNGAQKGEFVQPDTPVLFAGEPGSDADRAAGIAALRDAVAAELRAEVVRMNAAGRGARLA